MKPLSKRTLILSPVVCFLLILLSTSRIAGNEIHLLEFNPANKAFNLLNVGVCGFIFFRTIYLFPQKKEFVSQIELEDKNKQAKSKKETELQQLFPGNWLQLYYDMQAVTELHNTYHTITALVGIWTKDNPPDTTPKITVPVLAQILKLSPHLLADMFSEYLTAKTTPLSIDESIATYKCIAHSSPKLMDLANALRYNQQPSVRDSTINEFVDKFIECYKPPIRDIGMCSYYIKQTVLVMVDRP